MTKTAVVYQSKYGATKRYALWLAEALSCAVFVQKGLSISALADYDTIIYGGGLYAGGVAGIDFLIKHADFFSRKNVILFTCGLADPTDKENIANIRQQLNRRLPLPMQQAIAVFHLRGAIDYTELGPVHKAMMAMLYRMTRKKDSHLLREEDKEMLATYGKAVDFTDKAALLPIINYVKRL